jgi:hypothetical protein
MTTGRRREIVIEGPEATVCRDREAMARLLTEDFTL